MFSVDPRNVSSTLAWNIGRQHICIRGQRSGVWSQTAHCAGSFKDMEMTRLQTQMPVAPCVSKSYTFIKYLICALIAEVCLGGEISVMKHLSVLWFDHIQDTTRETNQHYDRCIMDLNYCSFRLYIKVTITELCQILLWPLIYVFGMLSP